MEPLADDRRGREVPGDGQRHGGEELTSGAPPSENQPHHAGAALVWGPDGNLLASTREEHIREEMIVATLDAALLGRERALANYMLRTRRPELFGELTRDQVGA